MGPARIFASRLFAGTGLLTAMLVIGAPGDAANPAPKHAVHTASSPVVQQLHATAKLLEEADHDYDGHRAKAVHEIHQAIHELVPHHQHPTHKLAGTGAGKGAASKGTGKKGAGNKEDQATSDAQLKQAIQQLAVIEGELQQHPKAAASVQAALHELATALKIK